MSGYDRYEGQRAERSSSELDGISDRHGITYREISQELDDSDEDFSEAARSLLSDCIDRPWSVGSPRQLRWLDDLYERYLEG